MSLDEVVVCPDCGGRKTATIDAPGFKITGACPRCCGDGVVRREAEPVPTDVPWNSHKTHGARPFHAGDFCYHVSIPPCPHSCFSNDLKIRERYLGVYGDAAKRVERTIVESHAATARPPDTNRADAALRILNLLNLVTLEIRAANVPEWEVVADACETMGKKIEETTLQGD